MIWRIIFCWLLAASFAHANISRLSWLNSFDTNDAAQRLVAVTDPVQRTTTVGYDEDGKLSCVYGNAQGVLDGRTSLAHGVVGMAWGENPVANLLGMTGWANG